MKQTAALPAPGRTHASNPKNAEVRARQEEAVRAGDLGTLLTTVAGLIWKEVRRYGRGLGDEDLRDLYAAGRYGALLAARRFDASRGAAFPTYATYWVRALVVREVLHFWGRGQFGATRATRAIFFRYGKARRALDSADRPASADEVADYLGVSPEILDSVAAATSTSAKDCGDVPDAYRTIEEVLCGRAEEDDLRGALGELDARSRLVLVARFYHGKRLREVAATVGVTRERVRQIEAAALDKLRRILLKQRSR